jgi:hypothetical protein
LSFINPSSTISIASAHPNGIGPTLMDDSYNRNAIDI